jgi:hypothetical protein
MSLAQKLVALAKKEVGVQEIDGSNCGPRVNEYKAATTLTPTAAWPWCAAFVCWLVREAMKGGSYTFKRPTTAAAWGFEAWSLAQDSSTETKKPHGGDIKAGDIVVFTFSHIGLALCTRRKRHGLDDRRQHRRRRQPRGWGSLAQSAPRFPHRSRIRFTV